MADKPRCQAPLEAASPGATMRLPGQTRRLTTPSTYGPKERESPIKPVSDASDTITRKSSGARVTLRLSERELARRGPDERDPRGHRRHLDREKQEAAHRAEHVFGFHSAVQ